MKRTIVVFAAVALAAVFGGCAAGGAMVRKDGVAAAGRIAVVSVTMPRIADTAKEGNRTVIQAAADRALADTEAAMKTVGDWTVVDAASYRGSPGVMSIPVIRDVELDARLPKGGDPAVVKEAVSHELALWKTAFVAPKGLPVVPRSAFASAGKAPLSAVAPLLQQHAAKACADLKVDAVVFVQVLANAFHPRPKTFIISNNRTDGTLRVAQTLVIVDKTGRIIADMGAPRLDEHARSRDLLPLYTGAGLEAVRPENIDLADPKNKIQHALLSLIDETSGDLVQAFKKAAGK